MLTLFTAHPATKGESYLQHGWFATRFGCSLLRIGCAALLHAVFPFMFEFTASDKVRSMYGVLRERYHWQD